MDFAARELCLPGFAFSAKAVAGVPNRTGRRRIGLLSPMFCLSPVYFLSFAAFSPLAEQVDFILFNRGSKDDSGTAEFRRIAVEWHDVQHLEAADLANAIKRQSLDVLFDLGGWSDPIGLKALSTKPAARMYKWVGGQSATTGLSVFDGFITDDAQSPPGSEALHSEPLIRCEGSYVAYAPPAYLPKPTAAPSIRLAIVSNPVKISRRMAASVNDAKSAPLTLIDSRYRFTKTRKNIERRLSPPCEFIAPKSHSSFLEVLASCQSVLDTHPYSMGLTACEATKLTRILSPSSAVGNIISSRHSATHLQHYSDYRSNHINKLIRKISLQHIRSKRSI